MAVWCLSRSGKPFEEHGYAPAQHALPVLALRVGNKQKKRYLSDSSRVTPVGEDKADPRAAKKDMVARTTAVPVAVTPDGTVLLDSWAIMRYAGFGEPEPDLKRLLDEELGPLCRQYAYGYLLKKSNLNIFDALCTEGRHWFWRACWKLFVRSRTLQLLEKTFRPNDVKAVRECREKLLGLCEALGERIEAKPTEFLGGEELGIADIAIASLMAPIVCAPLYCGGKYTHLFDKLRQQDTLVREDVEFWRNTTLGKYTLLLYQNHRL